MGSIKENVGEVHAKIEAAARRAGRAASEVQLIGVTKTIDLGRIRELIEAGVHTLGENRPQELAEKFDVLAGQAQWHLIGHLQTNKVKLIIDKIELIHSVDSLRLAETIDRHDKTTEILIEVNIAGEDTKHGVTPEQVPFLLEQIFALRNVKPRGLMCVAPFVEEPEENKKYFSKMREILLDMQGKFGHNKNLDHLSMGMTNDYEAAVEEGATMVRVGTGIFGIRNI